MLVLVSWLGSQYKHGFHIGASWDHKALRENANAAISVSLQPCFVHFTQDIHRVPLVEVQILRSLGTIVVLSYYLVEDWPAPDPLALELQPSWAHGHIPPYTLQGLLRGDGNPGSLLSWGFVTELPCLRLVKEGLS